MPVLALIPLALQLLPTLGRWLGGDTGDAVGRAAAGAVQAITGADTPEAAEAALRADPVLRMQLTQRLAEIAAEREAAADRARLDELRAVLADVRDARGSTVALAQAGSRLAWVPAMLTAGLVVMFGAGYFALLLGWAGNLIPAWRDVVLQLTGSVTTGFGMALTYWLGTSRGAVEMRQGMQRDTPFASQREPRA